MMNKNNIYCTTCGRRIDADNCVELGGLPYCDDCVETCYECGEVLPRANMVYCPDDSNFYCEPCADEVMTYCENCGERHLADNFYAVTVSRRGAVEFWCDDCVDDDAFTCYECGDRFARDFGFEVRGGYTVCDDCGAEYYRYCEECDEYVHYDDFNCDEEMCYDCAEKNAHVLGGYHSHNKNKLHGECKPQWRDIWRGYGLELEIDRKYRDRQAECELIANLTRLCGDAFVYERDGSLENGFEIITQPHTEDALAKLPWADVLNACLSEGYTSHDAGTCGLHVHISRSAFGSTSMSRENAIAKLIVFYDYFYDDIVKVSRRKENSAQQWARPYNCTTKKRALEIVRGLPYNVDRYHAVNITNSNTVEIRIMRGTLNIDTFNACLDFVIRTAKNAKKIAWRDVYNVDKWLEGLRPATLEYIKSHNAFLKGDM